MGSEVSGVFAKEAGLEGGDPGGVGSAGWMLIWVVRLKVMDGESTEAGRPLGERGDWLTLEVSQYFVPLASTVLVLYRSSMVM